MLLVLVSSAHRLKNAFVAVGNNFTQKSFDPSGYDVCAHIPNQGRGATEAYSCDNPVRGRFLTVYLQDPGCLSLCEVEVYDGSLFVHLCQLQQICQLFLHTPVSHSHFLSLRKASQVLSQQESSDKKQEPGQE